VLPVHPSSRLHDAPARTGGRGRIRALVLTSALVPVLAAVAGLASGLLVLAFAASALGATAVLHRRARRDAAHPAASGPAPAWTAQAVTSSSLVPDDLTSQLRRLHDDHVERVNQAVGEGRNDLAQELSDDYMDASLALITAGESSEQFHIR
jgi:hypothetical protein